MSPYGSAADHDYSDVAEIRSVREQRATARAAAAAPSRPLGLYARRAQVYPRKVSGRFRRIKWAALLGLLGLYYALPWVRWDRGPGAPDQAVLVDLNHERGYFFFIEIWPQEVYYLTGLLVLAAVGLFLATSLAGRVWCGYACPQTVWTDLFMWVERQVEGDRGARIRRDKQPWSAGKAGRKAAKHGAWLVIAFLTGGAWIMYFVDAPTVVRDFFAGVASESVYFFVGLFTATTYLLAGMAREQVCTFMCPWPRFQAAMLDEDSLVVTYNRHRGEPRGPHRKGQAVGRNRPLHRLQAVRRRLPDRHRYPRRPPARMHRLRPVRRFLQRDHGEGRPAAQPDRFRYRAAHGAARGERAADLPANPAAHGTVLSSCCSASPA